MGLVNKKILMMDIEFATQQAGVPVNTNFRPVGQDTHLQSAPVVQKGPDERELTTEQNEIRKQQFDKECRKAAEQHKQSLDDIQLALAKEYPQAYFSFLNGQQQMTLVNQDPQAFFLGSDEQVKLEYSKEHPAFFHLCATETQTAFLMNQQGELAQPTCLQHASNEAQQQVIAKNYNSNHAGLFSTYVNVNQAGVADDEAGRNVQTQAELVQKMREYYISQQNWFGSKATVEKIFGTEAQPKSLDSVMAILQARSIGSGREMGAGASAKTFAKFTAPVTAWRNAVSNAMVAQGAAQETITLKHEDRDLRNVASGSSPVGDFLMACKLREEFERQPGVSRFEVDTIFGSIDEPKPLNAVLTGLERCRDKQTKIPENYQHDQRARNAATAVFAVYERTQDADKQLADAVIAAQPRTAPTKRV